MKAACVLSCAAGFNLHSDTITIFSNVQTSRARPIVGTQERWLTDGTDLHRNKMYNQQTEYLCSSVPSVSKQIFRTAIANSLTHTCRLLRT